MDRHGPKRADRPNERVSWAETELRLFHSFISHFSSRHRLPSVCSLIMTSSSRVFEIPGRIVFPLIHIDFITYDRKDNEVVLYTSLPGRNTIKIAEADAILAQDAMDQWCRFKDPNWKKPQGEFSFKFYLDLIMQAAEGLEHMNTDEFIKQCDEFDDRDRVKSALTRFEKRWDEIKTRMMQSKPMVIEVFEDIPPEMLGIKSTPIIRNAPYEIDSRPVNDAMKARFNLTVEKIKTKLDEQEEKETSSSETTSFDTLG